ncbi:hypothetical protein AVEN_237291-1 [Araneus ventricosus]|uniref:Tc1-like transposase DDE domain-containing protein n=1 Tax=Araneus ventricosus TaxID=182803 RepID=A0A4Y2DMR0_ARAVE|nr:hypothetical protein AVEN_237291-1 [Araneus ventricosus]
MALAHRTASAAEIRVAVEGTVTNRLLHEQLRTRRPVACIPLTPNHCRLRPCSCLGASDGRVLVRRRPGDCLQSTCLRSRHTGPTPGVMVWGAISYGSRNTLVVIPRTLTANLYVSLVIQPVVLPFMNSIQGGVFQQDNARPHTAVVTQHDLKSVDMLLWPARSPDLSLFEHVWGSIGRQLQRHPQPALTVPVLTDQVQQAWNSISQTDIRHLYDTMHSRLHACIQNSGGYTGY